VKRLKAFALFWVDFVVGDDYSVAAGIVIVLGLCAALSRTALPIWWLPPVGVLGILTMSVARAALHSRRKDARQRAADALDSAAGDDTSGGLANGADPVVQRVDARDPEAMGVGPEQRFE
jgi:hypothetical protein